VTIWYWAIAAAVIAHVEMHAPGFYLIWVACGAATTAAGIGLFGISVEQQLITFALASVGFCIVGYFVYRSLNIQTGTSLNRRELGIVGAEGVVAEPIQNGYGKVRLGDTVWLAQGPDSPVGTPVRVRALLGTTVQVEAKTSAGESISRH
jgi:membrane protein implicated in regulation of membrane protease activity